MSAPTVCCVMLVNGRAPMVTRAIQCFRAQTYARKRLNIYDTTPGAGKQAIIDTLPRGIMYHGGHAQGRTIGALRNWANHFVAHDEVIAHWDSDDWSHPRRLEEQVALLEASGKQCVGYRDCLFWDTRPIVHVCSYDGSEAGCPICTDEEQRQHEQRGEAWLYRQDEPRFAIGASMLYRRELWEQEPFPNQPEEDYKWWLTPLVNNNCVGVSAIGEFDGMEATSMDPRMICQIHGANTEEYDREKWTNPHSGWTRAAEYDRHCAEVMALL